MTAAVVVGGGPNGLAAAIRLAQAGLDVTLVDAGDRVGGSVRTEELTLPGFRHDTFSSVYPAGAASPVFSRLPLADHGLEWVHPGACSAHPLPGGRAAVLWRDLDATAASLDALAPGDGDAWRSFAAPLLRSFPALRDTMLGGFPPIAGATRLALRRGPLGMAEFTRLLLSSADGFGHRLFASGDNRAWLHGAAMHGDTPPHKAGGAIAAAYLNLLGHAVGWPSPRGGAERLAEALAGVLGAHGGAIRVATAVEAVESAGGRVTGVRLGDGERLAAAIVVAATMPGELVRLAGDALARWYRAGLRRYALGPATLKLDWALDGPIPWEHADVRVAGTVHVGGGEQEFLASVKASESGLPEHPFLLLGQQTIADPSRAPAGKHTAWAYTHAPASLDWPAVQEGHAARMEAQVERFAPGFRDRILARHLLGPAELQARNRNLVGGDVGGGSYRLDQVVFRPLPLPDPYKTPLDGLYIGSAAAFPGGAVHGVPGDAAARAALRTLRRHRRHRR